MWGYGNGTRTSHYQSEAKSLETGERVACTFANDMVAHIWAQLSQDFGKSGNGNFYFNGGALHSYGSHFLVAYAFRRGNRIVSIHNADSYSTSTSQHQSTAWRAAAHHERHELPELTALRDMLPRLVEGPVKSIGQGDKARVRQWLESVEVTSEAMRESAIMVCRMAGLRPSAINAAQKAATRKAKAIREREERLDRLTAEGNAKQLAAASDSKFAEIWPRDGRDTWPSSNRSKPYEVREAETLKSKLYAALRAAKAKGWTRVAAEVSRKRQLYLAHYAERNARIVQAYRDSLAADAMAWRRGGARPHAWHYKEGGAIRAAIEADERREREAEHAAAFAAWKAGEGKRPYLNHFEEDSAEWREIKASEEQERLEHESAYLAWQSDKSQPRPPADRFLSGESSAGVPYHPTQWEARNGETISGYIVPESYRAEFAERFPFAKAWHELREAEQAEKAERERAEREAKLAAWCNGEAGAAPPYRADKQGGALMRIRGDMLETSQGASVPLDHAIKAFRMIKACKLAGKGWRRNGKQIRVGHFEVDSIDSEGNMTAGCHKFHWPEIARVAKAAGVFDMVESD